MKILKKLPLLNCCKKKYTSATFKNNYYIFPYEQYIDFYDYTLNQINKLKVCDEYKIITNGKKYDEYFAIKKDDNLNIYILDKCFNEISKITFKFSNKKEIVSIYLDCDKCKILIAIKDNVFSITLDGYFIKDELSKDTINLIKETTVKKSYERSLNGCCYYQPITYNNICISAVICFCNYTYIAYYKNNSSYIAKISDNGNIINNYYIDDSIKINSLFVACNVLTMLVTKDDCYNYIYISSLCCENVCEIIKDSECRVDYECDEKCNAKCCDNVICSIACMEKGLASILNGEGAKIQAGIKTATSIEELLKINDSVAKTVNEVTYLEQILYSKLKEALSCCDIKKKII